MFVENATKNSGILNFKTKWIFLTERDGMPFKQVPIHHLSIMEIENGCIRKVQ